MNPNRLLDRLCKRHGLQPEDAGMLLPLVQRAIASPDEARDRILMLVEDNLARKAGDRARPNRDRLFEDLDDEVLVSVAGVLCNWQPSSSVLGVSEILPDVFPEGFDQGDLPDA